MKVAVVGSGIAGASAARAIALAGHSVHVFDKARGPGGRLATRRAEWVDRDRQAWVTPFDHGAIGITAESEAFRAFIAQTTQVAWVADWTPALAPGSLLPDGGARLHLPVPDMPALCRRMLDGLPATWSFAVDRLLKEAAGWQVEAGGARHEGRFDAIVLAVPPAQAAPLLGPHRCDWARYASVAPMQACWTLMGVAEAPEPGFGWDLAQPPTGPLACVLRSDSRPGRTRVPGPAHWVAHARAGWSVRHLEQPATWIQQQMSAALAECLGRPVHWQHCAVHRWRFALPQSQRDAPVASCWWDPVQRLGVCGDFLGGSGAEGAWLSAQALAEEVLSPAPAAADAATRPDCASLRSRVTA